MNGKTTWNIGPRSLLRNPPNISILGICAFDDFILADKLLAEALRSFET